MLNEFAYLRETEGNIGQMFGLTIKHQPEFDGTALFDISSHITSYRKHLKDLSKDELEDSQKTRADELIEHYQKTMTYQNGGRTYSAANTKRIKALYDLSRAFIAIAIIEYKRKGIDGFMSDFVERHLSDEIYTMATLVGIDRDTFVDKYLNSSKHVMVEPLQKEQLDKESKTHSYSSLPNCVIQAFERLEHAGYGTLNGTTFTKGDKVKTREISVLLEHISIKTKVSLAKLAPICGLTSTNISSTLDSIRTSSQETQEKYNAIVNEVFK